MIDADLILRNADEVITCRGPAPRRGAAQRDAGVIPQGAVAALAGRIVFVGTTEECDDVVRVIDGARRRPLGPSFGSSNGIVSLPGYTVLPGFVDPHTHVVYAGDRRAELRRRLAGATYAEIASEGGGILSTVAATRGASTWDLLTETLPRLREMLQSGTTTCEAKSGYGLALEPELKMLRVIGQLGAAQPLEMVATFMGAHEVPSDYRHRRDEYVRVVTDEMLPVVARDGLAEWCDVFCERGVFDVAESRAILRAARDAGLKIRIHADELASSGGAGLAAELGARSADHLVFVTQEDARRLADAGTVATLLPAAAFFLKLGRYAPARMLIEEGVAVALATDINPGGGFSPSMAFVMSLACFGMGLTLEESLVAATINASYALDRHERVGSLEPGKQMDAVIVAGPATALLRGTSSVQAVLKGGSPVYVDLNRVRDGSHVTESS